MAQIRRRLSPSVVVLTISISLLLTILITTDIIQKPRWLLDWERFDCPAYGVVNVQEQGRLGNYVWEYAAVHAVAKRAEMQPFVPFKIRKTLDELFTGLTVPALDLLPCATPWNLRLHGELLDAPNASSIQIGPFNGPWYDGLINIIMKHWSNHQLQFILHSHLAEHAQKVLLSVKTKPGTVFVGVHVRRMDYARHLEKHYKTAEADVGFYEGAMNYFRTKYNDVAFIVASDDTAWCTTHLVGNHEDIFVVSGSAVQDFATLAACNHSIFDYGTFGEWTSILAGGETIVFDLTRFNDHSSNLASVLDHWHVMS